MHGVGRKTFTTLGLTLSLCTWLSSTVAARDHVVTHSDDPAIVGDRPCAPLSLDGCSLRAAVLAANHNPGNDRILLGTNTCTLRLIQASADGRSGPLRVTGSVRIVGASRDLTHIRWSDGLHGHEDSNVRFEHPQSAVSSMMRRSVSHGRGAQGGRPCATGERQLTDTVIGHCEGTSGGGLQPQGSLRLEHTVFRGNRANAGGAIEAARWATVVAEGADFVDTQAWLGGGAVSFRGAPASDG